MANAQITDFSLYTSGQQLGGAGAQGAVYKVLKNNAEDPTLAVKVAGNSQAARESLAHEYNMLGSVTHNNVVKRRGYDSTAHRLYLELAAGMTYKSYVESFNGVIPAAKFDTFKSIFIGIATGLKAMHSAGIAHTDIKPDNIMVANCDSGSPTVKIIDLGLARAVREAAIINTNNVYYENTTNAVHRDLYGLGVMICKTYNGTIGSFDPKTYKKHDNHDIPSGFSKAVKACTSAKSDERSLDKAIEALNTATNTPLASCCLMM
jgi:serine/threonine protein kinase